MPEDGEKEEPKDPLDNQRDQEITAADAAPLQAIPETDLSEQDHSPKDVTHAIIDHDDDVESEVSISHQEQPPATSDIDKQPAIESDNLELLPDPTAPSAHPHIEHEPVKPDSPTEPPTHQQLHLTDTEAALTDPHEASSERVIEAAPPATDSEQTVNKDELFVEEIEEYMRRIQLLEQMISDNKSEITTISSLLTLDSRAIQPLTIEAHLDAAYSHSHLVFSRRIDDSESFINHKYKPAAPSRRHKLLPSSSIVQISVTKKQSANGRAVDLHSPQSTSIEQYEDRAVHVAYIDHMQLLVVMLDDRSMVCLDEVTGKAVARVSMIEHLQSPITSSLSVKPSLMVMASADVLVCVDPSDRWSVTAVHRAPVVCDQDFERLALVRNKYVLWVCASDCFLLFTVASSSVILSHKFCPSIEPFDHIAHLSTSSVLFINEQVFEVDVMHSTVHTSLADAPVDGVAAYFDRFTTYRSTHQSVLLTCYVGHHRECSSSVKCNGDGPLHLRYLSFSALLLAAGESLMIIKAGQRLEVLTTLSHPPVLRSTVYSHIHSALHLLDTRRHIHRLVYFI